MFKKQESDLLYEIENNEKITVLCESFLHRKIQTSILIIGRENCVSP